jgi:hypothetical protein
MPIDLDELAVIVLTDEAPAPVVTDEQAPLPVTALELAAIKRARAELADRRAELGALTVNLRAREQAVIARIEAGARVEGAAVVLTRRRQSVSWLTVVARELGEGAVERIKNAWPLAFWKELQLM